MQKEIDAALAAAKKYKARNEGEQPHVDLIVAMLTDLAQRVGMLDELSASFSKEQGIRDAQAALTAAQSA